MPFGLELVKMGIEYAVENEEEIQGCFKSCFNLTKIRKKSIDEKSKKEHYRKSKSEWNNVNSLYDAIKWHDKYTPSLNINDYIYHYYPYETRPQM